MPGENPQKDAHVMMWDYNVGLVRITALFKSLKHSKVSSSLAVKLITILMIIIDYASQSHECKLRSSRDQS